METIGVFKDDPITLFKNSRWDISYRIERDEQKPQIDCFSYNHQNGSYLTMQIILPFISIWIHDCKPMEQELRSHNKGDVK